MRMEAPQYFRERFREFSGKFIQQGEAAIRISIRTSKDFSGGVAPLSSN